MPGMDWRLAYLKAYTYEGTLLPYRAVKTGSVTGAVVAVAAATDVIKGFTIEAGVAGENHSISETGGHILVEAGAAFAADVDLMIDSVGRVVLWAAAAGTNQWCVGKALEAATAAGDIVPMLGRGFMKQG